MKNDKILKILAQRLYKSTYIYDESDNLRLFVPTDSLWTFSEFVYYEKNVVYWIKKFLQDKQYKTTFYDIGANIGFFSVLVGAHVNQVYAFEPVDQTMRLLRTNLRLNGRKNVRPLKMALSDKTQRLAMNIYSSSGNNSIYKRDIPKGHELKFRGKQLVKTDTIDHLVAAGRITPPSLIKIDIEGAELPTLKGAAKTLKSARPIIVCEYGTTTSKDAGYSREDIVKLLKNLGYKIMGLSGRFEDNRLYPLNSRSVPQIDNIIAFPEEQYEKFKE